jgi:hypothetical protein
MSRAKEASRPKRTRKTLPVLGAAGLSLSLASGASMASPAPSPDSMTRSAAENCELILHEEEIFEQSLATFHVFDKDRARSSRAGERPIAFGGACCQFACLGGQSGTGSESPPALGSNAYSPAPRPIRPTHKQVRKSHRERARRHVKSSRLCLGHQDCDRTSILE